MRNGTWEEPMNVNVYSVCVAGPSGSDWLQATARDASEAEAAVRKILMPGVQVVAVQFVSDSEGRADRRAA